MFLFSLESTKHTMKSSVNREYHHALLINPDDMRYLEKCRNENFSGSIRYEAKCENNTTLEPESLEQLLDYENPDFRRISFIEINAGSKENNVRVVLMKPPFFLMPTVQIKIAVSDVKKQLGLEKEITERIRPMKPWYSVITRIPFVVVIPLTLFALSFILNFFSIMQKFTGQASALQKGTASMFSENEQLVLSYLLIGTLVVIGYGFDRLRELFLPKFYFLVGKQQRAFMSKQTVLTFIFGGIFLALIVSILANYISSLWF